MTFDGGFYRTDKATIYDRAEQPMPIWLAGSGAAGTQFAGRAGTRSDERHSLLRGLVGRMSRTVRDLLAERMAA